MSGSECYDSLQTGCKECWDEINQVIDDGQLEISPGHNILIEVFLGGDYKVGLYLSISCSSERQQINTHILFILYCKLIFIYCLSYKFPQFLLLVSGRSAANSNYACLWCKIHKDRR